MPIPAICTFPLRDEVSHADRSCPLSDRPDLAPYGDVVGRPARLNLGDALSYACAKDIDAPLLCSGDGLARIVLA